MFCEFCATMSLLTFFLSRLQELDSQYLTRLLGQLLKEFQQRARKDRLLSPEDSLPRLHCTAEQPVRKETIYMYVL